MAERTYYIVNKHGTIHECSKEHAHTRLGQVGFRIPEASELREYLLRQEQGNKRNGRPFMQTPRNPIGKPFEKDPDAAMEKLEAEMAGITALLPAEVNASDHAIEVAGEFGIDISGIEGSGVDGRVLKSDVMEFITETPETVPQKEIEQAPEDSPESAPEATAPEVDESIPSWFYDPEAE